MDSSTYWARRNAVTSYFIAGFENASASLPIWLLFFTRQLNLSLTAAIVLGMSRWATMAFCNIPTGAWADRFGRVKMYRIGQLFYALTYVPFLITKDFTILMTFQIIGGFLGSMSIGTVGPLVKDTYDLAGLSEHSYTKYLSTSTVVLYISRLVFGIFGAWLYVHHPYGPYVSEIVVVLCAFTCSMFLKEFRVKKSTADSNRKHISEAMVFVWHHNFLRNFLIATLVFTLASESLWTALQPSFVFRNISPEFFGLLFGIVALLSAAGAYISRHIASRSNGIKIKFFMVVTTFVGAALFLFPGKWPVILALLPLGLAFGFSSPIDSFNIQRHTSSAYQSTILSLDSLLSTGVFVIASVMVGRYADLFGTGTMIKILAAQAAVCTVIIGIIWFVTRSYKKATSSPATSTG